jgi:membrane protein implicated in regulation of membrane protease activity
MAFLVALGLAIFVLPWPWDLAAVTTGAAVELGEAAFLWRFSHRRAPVVGVHALIGTTAVVTSPCRPLGQVRAGGEVWQARCAQGADPGTLVRVVGVDGLVLVVEVA